MQYTSDYVSKQAAIKHLIKRLIETANNNVGFQCDAGETFQDASERVSFWVNELPFIDAVEVVRCKECKWFEKNVCNKFSNNYEPLVYVSPYDFCSRGEQKDG